MRNSAFVDSMETPTAQRHESPRNCHRDTVTRSPLVACSSTILRFLMFCYKAGSACGLLAHSLYSACPDCGKRVHREHNCTATGRAELDSMFVCRGMLRSGAPWGCGAKFETYMMLWLHISLDPAGATGRGAFVQEEDEEREGEDIADMFNTGLRLDKAESEDTGCRASSGPSVAITV